MDSSTWAAIAAWVGVVVSAGFAGWAAYSNRGAREAQIEAAMSSKRAAEARSHMAHGPAIDFAVEHVHDQLYALRNMGRVPATGVSITAMTLTS